MQIKFIGTGGAFDYEYGNSAAWVQFNGKNILIDCGFSIYPKLAQLDLIKDIDFVLITHLHDDHVGSLSTTFLHRKHNLSEPRPITLLYPTESYREELDQFFSMILVDPSMYYTYAPLADFPGLEAIETSGYHKEHLSSFAYLFKEERSLTVYSGDLGNADWLFDKLKQRDENKIRVFHDISFQMENNVHAFYKSLFKYVDDYEIYGYHHDPTLEPDDNIIPLVSNFPQFMI